MEIPEGYKKQLKVFSVKKTEWFGLLIFFIFEIVGIVINLIYFKDTMIVTGKVWLDVILAVLIVIDGIFIHELLHALCIKMFGKTKKGSITFGANIKKGFFYCHALEPISALAFKISSILPVIITGVIPYVICLIMAGPIILSATVFLIAAGCGDFVLFLNLLGVKNKTMVVDLDNNLGFYLLYKEGETPKRFIEATEEEETKLFEDLKERDKDFEKRQILIKVILIVVFLAGFVGTLFLLAHILKFI